MDRFFGFFFKISRHLYGLGVGRYGLIQGIKTISKCSTAKRTLACGGRMEIARKRAVKTCCGNQ